MPDEQRASEQYPLPQKIGRYRIEGLLTKGGMSLLYLASHPDTADTILVKVLLPRFLSSPDMCDRFLNEAKIISIANHPNIVHLYDYGHWEEGLYIAMEFVKGSSLRKILSYQPFSLKRALDILLQIAYALCHLHSHGIIHGDLKPENILISDTGVVKVIDFGIAQLLSDKKETDPAAPMQLIGTPSYMSPEQHESFLNISFQSDIYALGIIAYELIMGKISHGRIIISLAPRGMQKILHKALQPQPEDRYADVVDFISDLSQYIKSGTFQKDKHGSDYFLELFETTEEFQKKLLPAALPEWPGIEFGQVLRQAMGLSGLYYEFFSLDSTNTKKFIFLAESKTKGAQGVLLAAMLGSCIRTLASEHEQDKAQDLPDKIHAHMVKQQLADAFYFAYLLFDTKSCTYQLFQKEYACLLHFSKNERTVDHVQKTEGAWLPGDQFLLFGSAEIQQEMILALKDAWQETQQMPAQQQVDTIQRKLRVKTDLSAQEQPFCLISMIFS